MREKNLTTTLASLVGTFCLAVCLCLVAGCSEKPTDPGGGVVEIDTCLTIYEAIDCDGETVCLTDYINNGLLVVDFWSPNCGPCKAEIPGMIEVYEEYRKLGVEFVGLLDPVFGGDNCSYANQHGMTWPQLKSTRNLNRVYDVGGIPHKVFFDRDGNELWHVTGAMNEDWLREHLDSLLARGPSSEAEFDFGYVPQLSYVEHGFPIANTSGSALEILKVKSGCGCAKARISVTQLQPGESALLNVLYSSGKSRGRVSKSIDVTTNLEPHRRRLRFSAHVVTDATEMQTVSTDPVQVEFGPGFPGGYSRVVTLTNVTNQSVDLKLIDRDSRLVRVTAPTSLAAGGSDQVVIELVDPGVTELIRTSVTFETSAGEVNRFTIPIERDGTMAANQGEWEVNANIVPN